MTNAALAKDDEMMVTPKTIDIITGAALFREATPRGLLRTVSVQRYQHELVQRIREVYPDARVFVRWSPSRAEGTEVHTIPPADGASERVLGLAEDVRRDSAAWLAVDPRGRVS